MIRHESGGKSQLCWSHNKSSSSSPLSCFQDHFPLIREEPFLLTVTRPGIAEIFRRSGMPRFTERENFGVSDAARATAEFGRH
jgi:hypothetical protein